MKAKSFSPPLVGGASLLVIFAVICLTVFALLTVSTANAEQRLSRVSANAVSAYYKADAAAEIIFSEIRSGNVPKNVTIKNNVYSYTCAISDNLFLYVEVCFSNGEWLVLSWQPISSNR
jgi:Tfp pilus assembly protein PilX